LYVYAIKNLQTIIMGLPKKFKDNTNINPARVGSYRVDELMALSDSKTTFLPKSIRLEDLDGGLFNTTVDGGLSLVLDGKKVPSFFMTNERWGEFSKTWKYLDEDKNLASPFLTFRRVSKAPGTHDLVKYNIPSKRLFPYVNVPVFDGDNIGYDIYKIPQPVAVDLDYDLKIFSKYQQDINFYDEKILKAFASRQFYILVNGHYFSTILDGMTDSNQIDNIDEERLFVTTYRIKLVAYLQDESDFEIVQSIRRTRISLGL